MVKKATWRKFREFRIGRYRIVLYRERENASIFRIETLDSITGTYCGDIYTHFNDELTIISTTGSLTSNEILKIVSIIEDYLQKMRE